MTRPATVLDDDQITLLILALHLRRNECANKATRWCSREWAETAHDYDALIDLLGPDATVTIQDA